MQNKLKIYSIILLISFNYFGKAQITQDLRNLDWANNKGYMIYGQTIIPIFGQVSDNKLTVYGPRTNIAYKSLFQLNNDLNEQAKKENWDSIKLNTQIKQLNKSAKGGRIYLYLDRKTMDYANLRYFFSIVRDMNEKEIFSINFKQNEPYIALGERYASEVIYDIDKEVPDSFYVYINDRQTGELSDFKFKVVTMPKIQKYISYYNNNKVFTEGTLELGLKTGKWTKYHPNGKVGVIEEYIDDKLNGQVIEYFDDGALAAEKEYKNGFRNGIWKQYYYKIWIDGYYKNDKKDSIWNYYDTIGNLTAKGAYLNDLKNGNWIYYYNNHKESEGSYINDVENGEWKIFDSAGIVIAKGMINKGEEVPNSWIYYDNENNIIAIDTTILLVVDNMPQYREGLEGAMMYIKNNINIPTTTNGEKTNGKIFVSFVVEPNGTLSNIFLLKGLSTDIDNEMLRIFNKMPRWIPGYQNGRLVRVKVNMPILIGD